MASSFPTSLQDLDATRGTTGQTLASPNHITHHALEDDTLEAIQTKLGVDNSAVTTTIDYKLKSTSSINPGHLHTFDNLSDVYVPSPSDGDVLVYSTSNSRWQANTTSAPDASTTVKGVTKMSVAPASAASPIAVGDNDGRVPTQSENDALVGTGTPSTSNPFVSLSTLSGAIVAWGTTSAPTGWLLCDGSAVSRATYSGLFAILSTTYGSGDGSTTFNLPNLKGRVVVGYNASETEFDTIGETGGAKTHTLTVAEMPTHTHDLTLNNSGSGAYPSWGTFGTATPSTATTTSSGSSTAHNNLQPYITLSYIIKT
jgi:microcystin-dependent protein